MTVHASKVTVNLINGVVNANLTLPYVFNVNLQPKELLSCLNIFVFVKMDIIKVKMVHANHAVMDVLNAHHPQNAIFVFLNQLTITMELVNVPMVYSILFLRQESVFVKVVHRIVINALMD